MSASKVSRLKGRRYVYHPRFLGRYPVIRETPKFLYLGEPQVFDLDTGVWAVVGTLRVDILPRKRLPRVCLDNPAEPEVLYSYLDPCWIERAKQQKEKDARERKRRQERWEKKAKGFRAYDAFANKLGRIYAQTAEEALAKDPRAVYVELGDGRGNVATSAGRKPKNVPPDSAGGKRRE